MDKKDAKQLHRILNNTARFQQTGLGINASVSTWTGTTIETGLSINARVYRCSPHQIPTQTTQQAATSTFPPCSPKICSAYPISTPRGHLTPSYHTRQKIHPTSHMNIIILCLGHKQYNFNSTQYHNCWTSCPHTMNATKHKTITQLCCYPR